ncbi:dTDP-rhamnosyl transferase RfbF [Rhodovastum atsumiense]|uniref:Rhamnosyl transferase n=2 Tax=Rhodovastum atsumiense TaxID=504468 RepID=A0A5M6ISJ8_9PROT|nr:rhamnosyl transferase [Rhodovastum atsumiense]CAH2601750.1 dTDP-rhamnosyl transferase RfbF [Rhodovastum atsumiense]
MLTANGLPSDIGIVAYDPVPELLIDLVGRMSREAGKVWIFQNSTLDPALKQRLCAAAAGGITFLNDGTNAGLGLAYNTMAAASRQAGADLLLIFDQDSSPQAGMLTHLRQGMMDLIRLGKKPALIGPLPVSAEDGTFKPPHPFHLAGGSVNGTLHPAEFAISSGSLINLDAFEQLGGFRTDFFIDAVDIEWCFRAWRQGYSCWIDSTAIMPHRLGQGIIRIPVLGMLLARQPPARLYTYVRNQVAMMREGLAPLRWRLRLLPYLFVQGVAYWVAYRGKRVRVLRAFWWGASDGWSNRLGPGRRSRI